jgi:two-component system response regulator FixJ
MWATIMRRSLERLFGFLGFITASYATPHSFLLAARGLTDGCVLLDVKMPRVGGLEVQARPQAMGFPLPIILITEHGDIQTAVRTMKPAPSIFWRSLTRMRFC